MRIGIDLGGTKVEIAAFDDNGNEMHRRREPTPKTDYACAIDFIAELVRAAEHNIGTTCTVGVGIPGTIRAPGVYGPRADASGAGGSR